jgi:hypothetical protein
VVEGGGRWKRDGDERAGSKCGKEEGRKEEMSEERDAEKSET